MAHRVAFAGYELAVEERGSTGAPVVLVHSTGMSSQQWKRLAARLSVSHRVLLPDLIGYGESTPWPRGEVFHWHLDVLGLEALLEPVQPARAPGGALVRRPRGARGGAASPEGGALALAGRAGGLRGAARRGRRRHAALARRGAHHRAHGCPTSPARASGGSCGSLVTGLSPRAGAAPRAGTRVVSGHGRRLLRRGALAALGSYAARGVGHDRSPHAARARRLSPVGARRVAEALSQCMRSAALQDVAARATWRPSRTSRW